MAFLCKFFFVFFEVEWSSLFLLAISIRQDLSTQDLQIFFNRYNFSIWLSSFKLDKTFYNKCYNRWNKWTHFRIHVINIPVKRLNKIPFNVWIPKQHHWNYEESTTFTWQSNSLSLTKKCIADKHVKIYHSNNQCPYCITFPFGSWLQFVYISIQLYYTNNADLKPHVHFLRYQQILWRRNKH